MQTDQEHNQTVAAADAQLQVESPMPVPSPDMSPDKDVTTLPPARGEAPWTPDARTIIDIARNEAEKRGSAAVGSEHLLLAMTKVQIGPGHEILENEVLSIPEMAAHIEQKMPEAAEGEYDPYTMGYFERVEAVINDAAPHLTEEGLHLLLWLVAEKIKAAGGTPTLEPVPIPGVDEQKPALPQTGLVDTVPLLDDESLAALEIAVAEEVHRRSPEGKGEAHFRRNVNAAADTMSTHIEASVNGVRFITAAVLKYLGDDRVRVHTPPDLTRCDMVSSRIRTVPAESLIDDAEPLGKNFYIKRELPDGQFVLKIQRGKREDQLNGNSPEEVVEQFSNRVAAFCMLNK